MAPTIRRQSRFEGGLNPHGAKLARFFWDARPVALMGIRFPQEF